jgi:hypothetical protein
MDIIHPLLLSGLVLAAAPVVLHLIMRQKPKRLPFPAFRFLRQRYRVNQRKLNLQHLLLLLLRIAVICALCLALARPRLVAGRFFDTADRPVSVVLLFDTSASMEYTVGGVTRLDEAKTRARELLGELNSSSQVAVLDSGEERDEPAVSVGNARSRIDALRINPKAGALNRHIERSLRLLEQQDAGEETPPRILYIFSDRTRACWDPAGLKPVVPEGVQVVFVDVGVEKPRDLAIEGVEVIPPVMPPEARYEVRVRIRGTPGGHENQLSCKVDGTKLERPVKLTENYTGDVFVFDGLRAPAAAGGPLDVPYQVRVSLGARDALPGNNERYATFLVRPSRKLLTLVDNDEAKKEKVPVDGKLVPPATRVWYAVHAATKSFTCEIKSLDEAKALTAQDLAKYPIICMFEVGNPEGWWQRLASYVKGGGGLAIVPGGEEVMGDREDFNTKGMKAELLPAPLLELASAPRKKPLSWSRFSGEHPLLAPFVAWAKGVDPDFDRDDLRPFVLRYWRVGKPAGTVIASYDDKGKSPALLERALGHGRVVMFTSPLDIRFVPGSSAQQWNNYWQDSSFGLVLIDRVCRYLGGEATAPEMNFRCGQVPQVTLPAGAEGPFTLSGPGLSGSDRNVRLPGKGGPVLLSQAVQPGNYVVLDGRNQPVAGFSLNIPPVETDLERVPIEQLELVLGKGSVVQVLGSGSIRDALAGARRPPFELLPLLMMALLVVLTGESLLANRFYRRTPEDSASGGAEATPLTANPQGTP